MKSEVLPTRPARVRNLDLTLPGDSHEVHRQPELSGQRGLPARAFSGGAFQGLWGGGLREACSEPGPAGPMPGKERGSRCCPLSYLMTPTPPEDPHQLPGTAGVHGAGGPPGPQGRAGP